MLSFYNAYLSIQLITKVSRKKAKIALKKKRFASRGFAKSYLSLVSHIKFFLLFQHSYKQLFFFFLFQQNSNLYSINLGSKFSTRSPTVATVQQSLSIFNENSNLRFRFCGFSKQLNILSSWFNFLLNGQEQSIF